MRWQRWRGAWAWGETYTEQIASSIWKPDLTIFRYIAYHRVMYYGPNSRDIFSGIAAGCCIEYGVECRSLVHEHLVSSYRIPRTWIDEFSYMRAICCERCAILDFVGCWLDRGTWYLRGT